MEKCPKCGGRMSRKPPELRTTAAVCNCGRKLRIWIICRNSIPAADVVGNLKWRNTKKRAQVR